MTKRLRDVEQPNAYKDLLRSIATFQIAHPILTLGVIFAITIALIGGVTQVRTVASLEKMMPTDVPEIAAFNELRDNGMGQDILAIAVMIDQDASHAQGKKILDYEYYTYVKSIVSDVRSQDAVVSAYAFTDMIDAAATQMGISANEMTPQTYNSIIANPAIRSSMDRFVSRDQTTTIIIMTTDVSANDLHMNLLATKIKENVESLGRPAATKIALTGTPIIQQRLSQVIEHDRQSTERISALFVFVLVAIVFGEVSSAIVPMVIIILSVIWLYGIMGYVGLPISTLASGVAAMVIGIGVDFSIHLRNKYEYERKKGETMEYAIEETMANTGYVLTTVTIVTALAFLSFMIGQMPEMGRFGLLMTIGVTLSFILTVIGLPALFVVEERIKIYLRRNAKEAVMAADKE